VIDSDPTGFAPKPASEWNSQPSKQAALLHQHGLGAIANNERNPASSMRAVISGDQLRKM